MKLQFPKCLFKYMSEESHRMEVHDQVSEKKREIRKNHQKALK
jgi:hypothetical protein